MSGGFSHSGAVASTTNGQALYNVGGTTVVAPGGSGASTIAERVTSFVEKNKKALLIGFGASVVVAGGAAYYYSSQKSQRPPRRGGSSSSAAAKEEDSAEDEDLAQAGGAPGSSKKKKKKSKSKKSKEESISSTAPGVSTEGAAAAAEMQAAVEEADSESDDPLKLSSAQLAALSPERRKQLAGELKSKGNKAYSSKKFQEAITIYSKAIECDEQAVYYSNRAACYTNLNDNEAVIKDCTDALRLDQGYVKALNRRGQAHEAIGGEEHLFKALCDFTAGAIIDGFANEHMAKAVDRVMKQLASEKGAAIMKTREPRLPSPTFIKAYMEAFRPRARPSKPAEPTQGESTLFLAYDALDAKDYTHAFNLFNESLVQGIDSKELKGRALNMRGTFKFIIGDAQGALADLEESTECDDKFTQTWVKKASVHMELTDPTAAFAAFERAISIDDKDPDVYYHRGQVYFITGQFPAAIEEYRRSTELDKTFVFSQIQLAVAMYKNEQAEKALHMFKRIIKEFGENSPEVYNYYGEILLDRGEHTEALVNLDKAITLEKAKQSTGNPINVLSMVNKALCLYQSRQALAEAETICREALELDPSCDIAIATLGQLLLQQNKVSEAVESFERSAEIARTEPELVNALAYEAATKAQLDFINNYPEYAHKLGLAQGRM